MLTFLRLPHPHSTPPFHKKKKKKKKRLFHQANGQFLAIIMREVTPGHEIESEAKSYFGMGSFLVS